MKDHCLFTFSLMAALLAFASTSSAQLADAISAIDGETFADDAQTRYFNRFHCGLVGTGGTGGSTGAGGAGGTGGSPGAGGAGGTGGSPGAGGAGGTGGSAGANGAGGTGGSTGASGAAALWQKAGPEDTTFQIRIDQTGPVDSVFLWVGKAGAQCQQITERNETLGLCAEVSGNGRPVGSNFLVSGVLLQELIDARAGDNDIVTCDSSGLRGTEYQIFVFREAPTGDVAPTNYGIAPFFVDVEVPNPPRINTTPQRQAIFNIDWAEPDPPDDIQTWEFYASDVDDATTAEPLGITASLDKRSQDISAAQLGLAEGESAFVFMNASDMAFVSDPQGGNEGELSEGVMVTHVPVEGFCDASGHCSGCSVSPMMLANGQPGSGMWLLGLVFAIVCGWRLRP